jgi:hypothetical protein
MTPHAVAEAVAPTLERYLVGSLSSRGGQLEGM